MIPDEFSLPYVEDQWVVGEARGPALIDVEDPWIVEVAPRGGEQADLAAIAETVREAPGNRAIVLAETPPGLLSDRAFVVDVVAPALVLGPQVIINLIS